MNIEIKLKDPQYCDGCKLCLYEFGVYCLLDYWDNTYFTKIEKAKITENGQIIRPEICIKNHGK